MLNKEDEQYLNLLSVFHYVVGGIIALFSCFPIIHLAVGIMMVSGAMDKGSNQFPHFIGYIFITMALVFILIGMSIAITVIIAGRKLAKRRNWLFCFVVGCIECMLFPFGTVLGIFTIIILLKEPVKAEFLEGQPQAQA